MFAVEHEGVTPDIMALSKSITSGTVSFCHDHDHRQDLRRLFGFVRVSKNFFFMGHTYTANQIGAAVGPGKFETVRGTVDCKAFFKTRAVALAELLTPFKKPFPCG